MLAFIDAVAADLERLGFRGVFTGASTLPLLVTDSAVRGVLRQTKDVDVIVLVGDLSEYQGLQAGLRRLGYEDRLSEESPMCRLWREDVPVDLMPCPDHGVGTDNRWFQPGSSNPARVELPTGRQIAMLSPVYFAAAKIDAFRNRGGLDGALDWYGAPDLEDLLALVDGLPSFAHQVAAAPEAVAQHLREWAKELLARPDARDILAGNASSPGRAQILRARLLELSEAPN
ncbi:MAG: hypothetical protein VX899_10460 [Myxococcota bacterium]|nr:hypothetical protein [Myxococcota bacterium]